MHKQEYTLGVRRGLPVGLGYFSVSFGFGAMAVAKGLTGAQISCPIRWLRARLIRA